MRLLKLSIFAVAIFIFLFSYYFTQRINILFFFAVTGAIFIGGIGSAIIGGLYWKKGSTMAAWIALIVGAVIATSGVVLNQTWPAIYDGRKFPINGQYFSMMAMSSSIIIYIIISLLTKTEFNMDQLLHRGKYAIKDDSTESEQLPAKGLKALITRNFTRQDKVIYGIMLSWVVGWTIVFIVGTVYNLVVGDVSDSTWAKFWYFKIWLACIVSAITAVWFFIGGLIDVKNMFKKLAGIKRNIQDSGMVIGHRNLGEETSQDKEEIQS